VALGREARSGLGVFAELYVPEHLKTYQPTRRFTVAVSEGESIETWDAEIHEEKIGNLTLPTGRLIAADPTDGMFPDELIAFTRTVPPGAYPVVCGLVNERLARRTAPNVYVLIRFSEHPIMHWELALCPEQKAEELEGMQYFGFGVDSGLGGFFDESVKSALELEENQARLGYRRTMVGEILLDESTGGNLVVFTAGMGDGSYPCYWGLDAQDQPVCLLADFQILRSPEELQHILDSEEDY
jgi:Protein of unknown function (DUF4241)